MNASLNWLLGLRTLRFGDEGVSFAMAHPIPAWAWAMVIAACIAFAWLSYHRLDAPSRSRITLAGVRSLTLLLIVVLLSGPRLVKPNETEEMDWVLVLADRSASMEIRDTPSAKSPTARESREEQLRAALVAAAPALKALEKDRVVVWMGFDSGAYDLPAGASGGELPEPAGRRTAIGRALEQAMRRAAARPVAGVVLLSDGRSIDDPSKQTLRRLQAEKIPVFALPLGSPEPVADVAVRSVQSPRTAFVNDLVPVEVEIERIGGDSVGPDTWGKVQLIDRATGLVLDEQSVGPAAGAPPPGAPGESGGTAPAARSNRVMLTARPAQAGESRWLVRIVPEGSDLVAEDNEAAVNLSLEDRPLRVAYFDGYPRWEQRYVKNLLLRERSIRSASLLLAEGKRFVQEGDDTMASLPTSPEDWQQYDVVIMGDVRPDVFTEEQLAQLKEHIAIRGAGLLWIAGDGSTPAAWTSTGLADLLPFSVRSGPRDRGSLPVWLDPVLARPTAIAERYGVLRLTDTQGPGGGAASWWPAELGDASLGWPRLRWVQKIDQLSLKPTSEVLAEAVSTEGAASETSPLVTSMRYGAGRVLYVATDEIWRWRYGRGEDLPERFWLQLVRMLGRESLARAGRAARIEVSPARTEVEQPVRVTVELLDQRLTDSAGSTVNVRVSRTDAAGAPAAVSELTLSRESESAGSRTFGGTLVVPESGKFVVEVIDPLLAGERLSAPLEVWLPEDELRRPETDHALLGRLASATGGKLLGPTELSELTNLLPNRRVRVVGTPEEETLWDTPLALALLVGLLVVEWVWRRVIRLA
ncbi:MAG: hypothetical protein KF745_12055 [Phycisphaeraceae bacterium]|nr:hypothetical protein [Phycisphaeraceae bacterium]